MMELINMSIHKISLAWLTACFSCVAEMLNSPWMVALCHLISKTPHNTQHRTTRRRHQAATDSDVHCAIRPLVRIGHAGRTVAQTPTSFAPGA